MEFDYYEALGIEAPENTGAAGENTEDAAPESQESAGGEAQREPAAPAEEQTTEERRESGRAQSPEENARYAAIRRKAQREAQRKMEKELQERIVSAGLQAGNNAGPIEAREDPAAGRRQENRGNPWEASGEQAMGNPPYRNFPEESPVVRDARMEARRSAAVGAKAQLELDLNKVRALDPTVKGLEDLSQRPEYPEICRMVERGLSLPEAYKLVNFDALSRRAADATRQAALNQFSGKGHMRQSEARGEGAARVPADVAEEYRMLLPNVTNAEIQAHYNGYLKN